MNEEEVTFPAVDPLSPGVPAEIPGEAAGQACEPGISAGDERAIDSASVGAHDPEIRSTVILIETAEPPGLEVSADTAAGDTTDAGPSVPEATDDPADGDVPADGDDPADDAADGDDPALDADDDSSPEAAADTDSDANADDIRDRLVRQFEAWLDRMADGEPPPEGLPEELLADALELPEPSDPLGSDLYAVFAGLTKLSGEVGLQGRAFRQLADALAPSAQVPGRLERLEAAQTAVARELARRAEPDKSASPASEDVLAVLFDLYDRLDRGLKNFDAGYDALRSRAPSGGFLKKMFSGKEQADSLAGPASAMREGYRLTLSRLEAALLQWGIRRTGEVGEPFDPRLMAVVDVGTAPGVPDGSVLEVYRSGYVLDGHVLATARVKVAKAAASR